MITYEKFLRNAFVLVFLISACAVMSVYGDAGFGFTAGPNGYSQKTFDIGVNPTKSFGLGFSYSQFENSLTQTTKNYQFSFNFKMGEHFDGGLSLSNSPEVDNYKSYGWGASGAYHSGNDDLMLDAGLGLNRTAHSQYVALNRMNWVTLSQSSIEPFLNLTLNNNLTFKLAYSKYSYTPDIKNILDRAGTFLIRNIALGGVLSLINDFPDYSQIAGASYRLTDNLKLGGEFTRIYFVSGQPAQDSQLFSVSYDFGSAFELGIGYNVIAYKDRYYSCNFSCFW